METFEEEDPSVQLQLLTATVKCFLKAPEETQEMVQRVLDMATEEVRLGMFHEAPLGATLF